MLKKILTSMTAAALVLAVAVTPAFAEYQLPDGADAPFTNQTGNDKIDGVEVEMAGYLGEDAIITDPDQPPTKYEINVTVPTALVWAAFESKAGVLDSPKYKIINNSQANVVTVDIASFEAKASTAQKPLDNDEIDKNLELAFDYKLNDTADTKGAIVLIKGDKTTATYLPGKATSAATIGNLDPRTAIDFTLEGKWLEPKFDVAKSVGYLMTLNFTYVTTP